MAAHGGDGREVRPQCSHLPLLINPQVLIPAKEEAEDITTQLNALDALHWQLYLRLL